MNHPKNPNPYDIHFTPVNRPPARSATRRSASPGMNLPPRSKSRSRENASSPEGRFGPATEVGTRPPGVTAQHVLKSTDLSKFESFVPFGTDTSWLPSINKHGIIMDNRPYWPPFNPVSHISPGPGVGPQIPQGMPPRIGNFGFQQQPHGVAPALPDAALGHNTPLPLHGDLTLQGHFEPPKDRRGRPPLSSVLADNRTKGANNRVIAECPWCKKQFHTHLDDNGACARLRSLLVKHMKNYTGKDHSERWKKDDKEDQAKMNWEIEEKIWQAFKDTGEYTRPQAKWATGYASDLDKMTKTLPNVQRYGR